MANIASDSHARSTHNEDFSYCAKLAHVEVLIVGDFAGSSYTGLDKLAENELKTLIAQSSVSVDNAIPVLLADIAIRLNNRLLNYKRDYNTSFQCSVIFAALDGQTLHYLSMGDCRLAVRRDEYLFLLNGSVWLDAEGNPLSTLVTAGQPMKRGREIPPAHVLGVSQLAVSHTDVVTFPLQMNDVVLIYSDGVDKVLSPAQILDLLLNAPELIEPDQAKVKRLVSRVLDLVRVNLGDDDRTLLVAAGAHKVLIERRGISVAQQETAERLNQQLMELVASIKEIGTNVNYTNQRLIALPTIEQIKIAIETGSHTQQSTIQPLIEQTLNTLSDNTRTQLELIEHKLKDAQQDISNLPNLTEIQATMKRLGAPVKAEQGSEADSKLFQIGDFLDPAGLCRKLKEGADPVSNYLSANFSPTMRQLLDQYTPAQQPTLELLNTLVDEFNVVLKRPSLYEQRRFALTSLREDIWSLAGQAPQDEDLLRLNRMLLEDAYPNEIAKSLKDVIFGLSKRLVETLTYVQNNPAPSTTPAIEEKAASLQTAEPSHDNELYLMPVLSSAQFREGVIRVTNDGFDLVDESDVKENEIQAANDGGEATYFSAPENASPGWLTAWHLYLRAKWGQHANTSMESFIEWMSDQSLDHLKNIARTSLIEVRNKHWQLRDRRRNPGSRDGKNTDIVEQEFLLAQQLFPIMSIPIPDSRRVVSSSETKDKSIISNLREWFSKLYHSVRELLPKPLLIIAAVVIIGILGVLSVIVYSLLPPRQESHGSQPPSSPTPTPEQLIWRVFPDVDGRTLLITNGKEVDNQPLNLRIQVGYEQDVQAWLSKETFKDEDDALRQLNDLTSKIAAASKALVHPQDQKIYKVVRADVDKFGKDDKKNCEYYLKRINEDLPRNVHNDEQTLLNLNPGFTCDKIKEGIDLVISLKPNTEAVPEAKPSSSKSTVVPVKPTASPAGLPATSPTAPPTASPQAQPTPSSGTQSMRD